MSFGEEGKGLLGTLVTWKDIQKDLYKAFGPTAKLSEDKKIEDIGDGKGFASRIGVVVDPWDDQKHAERQEWPQKFVVKIASILQLKKYADELDADFETKGEEDRKIRDIKRIHNVECLMYRKLKDIKDLPLLKIYAAHSFTSENPNKGYLIMEYVENPADIGNDTFIEEDVFMLLLRVLARYHSCSVLFTQEERNMLAAGVISEINEAMIHPSFVETADKNCRDFLGEGHEDTLTKLYNFGNSITVPKFHRKMDDMAEHLEMDRVLCHGDLWSCNVMCTEIKGKLELYAFIDLQTSHYGCVGHDLARIFASMLTYKDRKKKTMFYLETYFSYFTDFWSNKKDLPFSFDQMINAYQVYLPFALYVVAVSTAALGEMRVKQSDDPEKTRTLMQQKVIDWATELTESEKRSTNILNNEHKKQ